MKATDQAGNTDPTADSRSFTVDTAAPDTTITSGPSGLTADASPSFDYSSSEPTGASFQCKLDGPGAATGSFADCTPSPKAYSNLADGTYTFSVKASDQAGNTDPTPDSRSFTVDTAAPDTTITSGPSGLTADASPSFDYSSSEPTGASFQCKLDGPGAATGAFADCTPSPKAYSNLADGTYTFSVKASDQAGNTDPTPDSRSFTVDTAAPDTPITASVPGSPSSDNYPLLKGTAPAGSTVTLYQSGDCSGPPESRAPPPTSPHPASPAASTTTPPPSSRPSPPTPPATPPACSAPFTYVEPRAPRRPDDHRLGPGQPLERQLAHCLRAPPPPARP